MMLNNHCDSSFDEQPAGPAVFHIANPRFQRSDNVTFNCFQAQNLSQAIRTTWNSVSPEDQNRILAGTQDRLTDLRTVITQVPLEWRDRLQESLVDLTATLHLIKEKQGINTNPTTLQKIEKALYTTNTLARFTNSVVRDRVDMILEWSNSAIDKSIENPSFSDIEQRKNDATYAQQILSRLHSDHPIKTKLEQIVRQYENLVNTHAVLQDLDALEQFLKSPTPNDSVWWRFQPLIAGPDQLGESPDQLLIEDVRGNQLRWQEIRKKIWNAAKEVDQLSPQEKRITWISGSRSSAIPMIEHVSRTALARKPALVPTEPLLMHNLVPLSGEMSFGIEQGNFNTFALSGMHLPDIHRCLCYAILESFLFKAQTEIDFIQEITPASVKGRVNRLRAAVLRLVLTNHKPELWPALKEHILSLVEPVASLNETTAKNEDWPLLSRLIGLPVPAHMKGMPLHPEYNLIKGDIIGVPQSDGQTRFVMVLQSGNTTQSPNLLSNKNVGGAIGSVGIGSIEQAQLYKDKALEFLAENQLDLSATEMTKVSALMKTLTEKLMEIPSLFDTVQPLNFSDEQLSLIKNSFPIIWGSYSAVPRYTGGEFLVSKTMELGDDIQLVFTNEEHVERLNRSLNRYGVKAFSFEAANYLNAAVREQS